MCNANFVLDNIFRRYEIRKHEQELKNKHGNNETNDQNDNIFTTKSEGKDLIRCSCNYQKYSYRPNTSTEHFHISTKIHSMIHHGYN